MADTSLLDRIKRIMYGDAPGLMDLVTKHMYGYDSKTTATGKQPNKIDLTPKLPNTLGFTQEHVAFTFGRFSVPSTGHALLIERLKEEADEHIIFASHSEDPVRNPLPFDLKIQFMETFWPDANIYSGNDVRTLFDAVKKLEESGVKSATLVVGADRQMTFQELLERYADDYTLTVGVVGVERSEESVSATKMRQAVLAEDFESFRTMVPSDNLEEAQSLFSEVAQRIKPANLKEQVQKIMKTGRVPMPGAGTTVSIGVDGDLGDGPEIARRASRKRFKQVVDET